MLNNIQEHQEFFKKMIRYGMHPCFFDKENLYPANPYKRPLRLQDCEHIDFSKPITIDEINSNKNLIMNQLLLTIYEQDLLFLDEQLRDESHLKEFKNFYQPEFVGLGKNLRSTLERLTFDFLKNEIEIIGRWNKQNLHDYLREVILQQTTEDNLLCQAIERSQQPETAAKMLLIQMAPDFLSEASAMARTLPGAFGEQQSELMKIFIDEYGYGVHNTKHSTLFEHTLLSANMNKKIHHYYNSYLPTSLMLVNYFHFVCANKASWFKYLGALYYTEASIPHFNSQVSKLLKNLISGINTDYFDEHVHIDQHHERMVLEKLIFSNIDRYGETIIDDILEGFEAVRLLQRLADKDLIAQIIFNDNIQFPLSFKQLTQGPSQCFEEFRGDVTTAHIHAENELFSVVEGTLEFHCNGIQPIILHANEQIIIPAGRLHSTIALADKVVYIVQTQPS